MAEHEAYGREILPIPERRPTGITTYDAKDPDTQYPPIRPVEAPKGAPNVLVILLDDVGFGAPSAFGGPCQTPTAERLAARGLKYNRFHTTALCSPSRSALLTGRNHHSVGMGGITEIATSAPGYTSIWPDNAATLAQTLLHNGYGTAHIGKCHEVPVWETSSAGPFRQWPVGKGMEYFYGFIGGDTHQYFPALVEGTTPIEAPRTPEEGYHLSEDLADRAVAWVKQQKSLLPEKPVFLYFAPGATHAPHHVPKGWIEKYKGKFDQGWDKVREETFARQKSLGVVPQDADLTARPDSIPAWDEMEDEVKPLLARQMEIYAAFLEHTDAQAGRVVDAFDELGVLNNTLVFYVIGDNGASAESTIRGTFNEMMILNGDAAAAMETPEFMLERMDKFGGPEGYNHYAVGWAHAMCTPYQWTKQVASHWGGTRNGTVVHWPEGIKASGEVREQFHHIIDIFPTVLEACKLPHPVFVNGIQQKPIEGTSMVYSFDAADEPERHDIQYFEMFVNRGIYYKGWTACTKHVTPWVMNEVPGPIDEDEWELYGPDDPTQANNLAAEMPEKLKELQRLFLIEAAKYNVLPLDDRRTERFNPDIAGRPTLVHGNSQLLFKGMARLHEDAVINTKNKSHAITAEIEVPEDGASGVIIAQGGSTGGWSFYANDGKLTYLYNLYGVEFYRAEAGSALPAGKHQVRAEFAYDGGGLGKGGTVTLYLDGDKIGEGRVEGTMPMIFSFDETVDLGTDYGTPVSGDYTAETSAFSGSVNWVQIDIADAAENADHLISAEDRLRVAMARQ